MNLTLRVDDNKKSNSLLFKKDWTLNFIKQIEIFIFARYF